jgi:AraC-like DNA-binding protein
MSRKKTRIYIYNHTILIQGLEFDTKKHSHHAIKILINLDDNNKISLNDTPLNVNTIILDADIKHKLHANNHQSIILLINPDSTIGNHLRSEYLQSCSMYSENIEYSSNFKTNILKPEGQELSKDELKNVLNEILSMFRGEDWQEYQIDNRIKKALKETHSLEEKKISTAEIASWINLSESRFMHVFKEEVRIPFRRYLSWLRIIHAIRLLTKGNSVTESAMESGFTDVSHLHKTFGWFFGVNFSTYLNNSSFLQVHDYGDM